MNTSQLKSVLLIGSILLVAGIVGGYFYGRASYQSEIGGLGKLKAAWIYIGPIGDYGWTYAHDYARKIVDQEFPWLETAYAAKVDPADVENVIRDFISKGYTLIFTTSYDFMNGTYKAAEAYPDVMFFHCSGTLRRENMGTYFAEFYQIYYLNGLLAGALTQTGKLGYIAAHLIPEVVRHINAFALGAMEMASYLGKNITVYVRVLGSWYAPDKARQMAQELVEQYGVDVLAFTEDSPATIQYAQQYYNSTGKVIYTFSHYSPMLEYGPDVVVSGQLVHWEKIYEDIVVKAYLGVYNTKNLKDVDYWWMLKEGAVELGADFGVPINPKFNSTLAAIKFNVTDKLRKQLELYGMEDRIKDGKISVLDLIDLRLAQMKEENPTFDPFTGPITGYNKDTGESVYVPEGVRLSREELWSMNWFVSVVVAPSA